MEQKEQKYFRVTDTNQASLELMLLCDSLETEKEKLLIHKALGILLKNSEVMGRLPRPSSGHGLDEIPVTTFCGFELSQAIQNVCDYPNLQRRLEKEKQKNSRLKEALHRTRATFLGYRTGEKITDASGIKVAVFPPVSQEAWDEFKSAIENFLLEYLDDIAFESPERKTQIEEQNVLAAALEDCLL